MKTHRTKSHSKKVPLSHLITFPSPAAKGSFTRIIKVFNLSVTQNYEIKDFYEDADKRGLDNEKVMVFLTLLDDQLNAIKSHLPHAVQKKLKSLNKLQLGLSLENKLKTSMPILAYVLVSDLTDDLTEPFIAMWLDVKNGLVFREIQHTRGLEDKGEDDITNKAVYFLKIPKVTIYLTPEKSLKFTCGAAICVDGSTDAYGPDDSGADYTASAGHNKGDVYYKRNGKGGFAKDANGNRIVEKVYDDTAWWAVVTDTGNRDGKPLINAATGYYISTSSYNYIGVASEQVPERYVNADRVPFTVLSKVAMAELNKKLGLNLGIGDLVYVWNIRKKIGKWVGFLERRDDDDRIGEVSACAAVALQINENPRIGGEDSGIIYTFYPNTGPISGFRNDKEAADYIARNGRNILEKKPLDRNPRIPSK